eukprot:2966437-Pyramimonas_sp.AAC.1
MRRRRRRRRRSRSWSPLGANWRLPEGLKEPLRGLLGALRGLLGAFEGNIVIRRPSRGPPWAILMAYWCALGPSLGASLG